MMQLERYFFTISQIISNPDFNPERFEEVGQRQFNVSASAKCSTEGDSKKLFIAVILNNDLENSDMEFTEETPYCISTQVVGFFNINNSKDVVVDDIATNKMALNAAQMLIGTIRDHILTMTGKSAWGPAYLPAIYLDSDSFVVENE